MMDTAMKERLVGAAILVVLVVLVVPALLSGPRPPPAQEPVSQEAADVRVVEIDLASGSARVTGETGEVVDPAATPPPTVTAEPAAVVSPQPGTAEPAAGGEAALPVRAAPAPPAEEAGVPAPSSGSGWAVQVAALSSREAADRMAAELRQRGYPAFVLEYRADGRVFYRVRVGPEASRERADALAGRLQGEGMKTSVVAHP
jgi:DedD protein